MTLKKHEKAIIQAYRLISRNHRQIIWCVLKDGMRQQKLRIFFD